MYQIKYRLLTEDEQSHLSQEFIHYLASNSITGEDWESIKQNKQEEAQEHFAIFSDMVMEGAIENIHYIELKKEDSIQLMACLKEEARILQLDIKVDSFSFLNAQDIQSLADGSSSLDSLNAKIFSSDLKYPTDRNLFIFSMLNQGYQPVSKAYWNNFNTLVKK